MLLGGARVLASARGFADVHGAVVRAVLDDPLPPVRYTQGGVVLAGLNQIASPGTEAVAAGRRHVVVELAAFDASGADARVQGAGLVVRGDRDRLTRLRVGGDVVAGLLLISTE